MVESKYNANDIVKLLCRHVQGMVREMQDTRALERQTTYRNAAEAWLAQRNNVNVDNALYGITSTITEEERQPRVITHHHYFRHEDRIDREDGWPGGEEALRSKNGQNCLVFGKQKMEKKVKKKQKKGGKR